MNFDNYSDNQIIYNSDRLVLNAKKDNIFLIAKKDLSISTGGDLHVDTNEVVVNANSITFGLGNNQEPVAKADSVVSVINNLMSSLASFCSTLSTATGQGVGVISLVTINTAAQKLLSDITQQESGLNKIKSTITFTN
jgi:hypothetical protein